MSDTYRPMRAYEFDTDKKEIVGRFHFIIGGEMADGMKCWYRCDAEGNITDEQKWYSMSRMCGKMIAILEGIG